MLSSGSFNIKRQSQRQYFEIQFKMKASISISFVLWLSLANLLFTKAALLGSRASSPSPTRPFTVSAFESPGPIGQGITGYNLTARDGNLYLSPKPNGKLGIALPTAHIGLITQQSTKPSYMSMDMEARSWYVSSSFISQWTNLSQLHPGSTAEADRPRLRTPQRDKPSISTPTAAS